MMEDQKLVLQSFLDRLNKEPAQSELDRTPDGKAFTLPISFVEMTLDEIYLGLWGTENYKWNAIANEVQGSLELVLTHPITGKEIRRTGAASIVITVDSLSDDEKKEMTKQDRNLYALNPENKKPNALDLGFPKLKAECVKNAAQSLGKIFGRDLNRKKKDVFQVAYKELTDVGFAALLDRAEKGDSRAVEIAKATFALNPLQLEMLSNTNGHTKQLGE